MICRLAVIPLVLLAGCTGKAPQSQLEQTTIGLGVSQNGCEIGEVVDGDTVKVVCIDGSQRNARLVGFDTPEIFSAKCARERALGLAAKQTLATLVRNSTSVRAGPVKGSDKYGRLLFRLYLDGKDVADSLIERGLARPYEGGKRQPWCGMTA